jgi:flagellar hook-associated protein 1 FlgK
MSDIYGIMSLAGQALLTQQQAISVTSHNIANVNTPGYSRQRLTMTTRTPLHAVGFNGRSDGKWRDRHGNRTHIRPIFGRSA